MFVIVIVIGVIVTVRVLRAVEMRVRVEVLRSMIVRVTVAVIVSVGGFCRANSREAAVAFGAQSAEPG